MGLVYSLLAKGLSCSVISGYTAHRLLSLLQNYFLPPSVSLSQSVPRSVHVALTGFASCLGLGYYLKVWLQDYYIDWDYNSSSSDSSSSSCNRDLTGRVAVVTGGTVGGLGFAAAELLYRQGATVVVTVRTKEKGESAVEQLLTKTKKHSTVLMSSSSSDAVRASYVLCDFLSEPSARNCASELRSRFGDGIDFLILNAGISSGQESKTTKTNTTSSGNADDAGAEALKKATIKRTNVARVWMANHVGPFVFANELMPSLIQKARRSSNKNKNNPSESPRVVWVSSGAHKNAAIYWDDPFHPPGGQTAVYAQSKLANVMHAREYQKRVRDRLRRHHESSEPESEPVEGDANAATTTATAPSAAADHPDVKCFALTPGAVWTNLLHAPRLLYPLLWFVLRTPTKGAQVIKMACLDNDLQGGEYLSNCYVKETQGVDGCSNDQEQWKRLWELTEEQIKAKEYEHEHWFFEGSALSAAAANNNNNKKTD